MSEDAQRVYGALTDAWMDIGAVVEESGVDYPQAQLALRELSDFVMEHDAEGGKEWARYPEQD